MPKHDRSHFDNYSYQNRAKHQILTSYLPAYLKALKTTIEFFHYIDGFAGRGVYADQIPGSPLQVLDVLQQEGYATRSIVSLVEAIDEFFSELENRVSVHPTVSTLFDEPLLRHGRFSDYIDEILDRSVYTQTGQVGTFSFIDPCGIEGVRMRDLVRLLQLPFGEVLLFFNYGALSRYLGGISAGTHSPRALIELIGSGEAANDLIAALDSADPLSRELVARDSLVNSLKAHSGARFYVPFRFEAKDAERTRSCLTAPGFGCIAGSWRV